MNEEDTPDRYNRLRAIKDFGYDITWDELHDSKVVVVGVGGLGSIISDQLARCGVGELILFDMDVVEDVNLNRMGFNPNDVGLPKVKVVSEKIRLINPDVTITPIDGDIMSWDLDTVFDEAIATADLVMMGLDNFPARVFTNQKCARHKKVLINAGVSRAALSGFVHPIFPGKNACIMCSGTVHGSNEKKDRSAERCNASLPTTMALIASIQVQEALKFLLKFGEMIDYLSYNAINGQFYHYKTQRDPTCTACHDVITNEDDFGGYFKYLNELNYKKK